jgi:cyclopropane fatty-acyl-phospholipid synthase-like methyltransferase
MEPQELKPSPLVARFAGEMQKGPVLDIGFGNGKDSLFLASQGFKVTALSIDKKAAENLEKLKKEKGLKIEIKNQDIRQFSFSDNYYTAIIAMNTLFFLSKNEFLSIIEKIKNSLKPGGVVIISSFTMYDQMFTKMQQTIKESGEREFQDDKGNSWYFLALNELENLFHNFSILFSKEEQVQDKGHPGSLEPHTHTIARIVAKK